MTEGPDFRAGGWDTYRRLLRYALVHWQIFGLAIVGMALYALTDTGFAALMKPLLDQSFVEKDPEAIRLIPLALIGIFAVRAVAGFLSGYCMTWVGRRVIKQLRRELFDKLLRLPAGYYDTIASGELLSKLTYNVEQVANAATKALTTIIRDSLTVIALIAWMFYLSPALATFIVVVGPIMAGLVAYISRRFRRISRRIQASMGQVTHVVEEVIEGNRVVKLFGGQDQEKAHFERVNERNRRQHMKMAATNAAATPIIQFLVAVALAGIIAFATHGDNLERISPGTFVSFITAMTMLFGPLKRLTTVNAQLQKGIAAGESIFELLDWETEPDHGAVTLERAAGRLVLEDVYFAYQRDKGPVLHGIDLAIEPGETVALVGRSGSGKSTLVNLLPRFYELERGRILLDDRDVRDYALAALRRQFTYVGQEVTLFNESIARNIAYGSLETASEADIREAARAAHALDFIEALPEGFDTEVGENGVLLSGGQRQRIAIARALLKDAPVLILDEATSALDTESERHIQAALDELIRDRTTLVIAHRLSTIENADRIVVMHDGRIAEVGSHRELLQRRGRYAALYNMQFADTALEG